MEQRNPFKIGDKVEILSPVREPFTYTITEMIKDENSQHIENDTHPHNKVYIPIRASFAEKYSYARRKNNKTACPFSILYATIPGVIASILL